MISRIAYCVLPLSLILPACGGGSSDNTGGVIMGVNTLTFSCAQVGGQATCSSSYNVNGKANPTIVLVRGQTYTFTNQENSAHPLMIQSTRGIGGTKFTNGITPATPAATVTFVVPTTAPDTLFYQCNNHTAMNGQLMIVNALDVATVQALEE
jgi:hypothetical protein